MNKKGFRLQVTFRLLLVVVLGWSAYYVITYTPFWLLFIWLFAFTIWTFVSLIRYVEKTQRDLSAFLMTIQQNDFANVYPEHHQRTADLFKVFNVITSEFIKLRSEKESSFHFLKTVVEHSGVPLLAYRTDTEEITLINEAAKKLLGMPHVTQLSAIKRVSTKLLDQILLLGADEKQLSKLELGGETYHLSIMAKVIRLQSEEHKVIALHNINSELDQQEIESWQKLIRVLSHEIKNSAIPIATLSEAIGSTLWEDDDKPRPIASLNDEDEDDLRQGLKTIEKRSKGLAKFVSSYSELARVPQPNLETVNLTTLIERVVTLNSREIEEKNIRIQKQLTLSVEIPLDSLQIEQVLINLIKNSIEALDGINEPEISIRLDQMGHEVHLAIRDNGSGMEKEILDNIFVPFYTTKTNGSGIGLSLSRQIIRAHKGQIRVESNLGKGTSTEILLWSYPK